MHSLRSLMSYIPYTAVFAAALYLLKKVGEWTLDKVRGTIGKIEDIHEIIKYQTENHLSTIQDESKKQTEILHRLAEGQAEANGFLSALVLRNKRK